MVVEHDGVEAQSPRFRDRLMARGPAVDGDEEAGPLPFHGTDRLHVRTISFRDAVWNVDEIRNRASAQILGEERGAAGSVHIVVAENRHCFPTLDRIGETS